MTNETENRKVLFSASKSRQNLPAFWEKRNDSTFLTYTELIASGSFGKKQPIYINNLDTIPAHFHALFVAAVGDIILKVTRNSKGVETFQLYVITDIIPTGDKFTLEADEVIKTSDPSDIWDNFATGETLEAAKEFIEAGRSKLDLDRKVSVFAQQTA